MAKKCPPGKYYCFDDKKCKKIPRGYHIGARGYLARDDDNETKKNGNGNSNGNGNGGNGAGNGNGGSGGGANGNGGGMGEEVVYEVLDKKDIPHVRKLVKKLRAGSKTHAKQADDLEVAMNEATMTPAQKRKDTMLKKKYDKSDMKKNMKDQYGEEEGKKIYFATIRKQAMKEGRLASLEKASILSMSDDPKDQDKAREIKTRFDYQSLRRQMKKSNTKESVEGVEDDKYNVSEEGLRDWFGKSSGTTKSGRKVKGWVQVGGKYDGKPCARQPGQKSTPKCVSSSKRASMSDKERDSAARRKRAADPNQPQKSGAAKPTNVSTDPKKKMSENYFSEKKKVEIKLNPKKKIGVKVTDIGAGGKEYVRKDTMNEAKDKKGKGSGKKDACYNKVKSRYSVWPSAYASGALVKCRKVGAANWGNKTKKEGFSPMEISALEAAGMIEIKEGKKCWKGYEKKGTQKLFGKTYNRCVKKESYMDEAKKEKDYISNLSKSQERNERRFGKKGSTEPRGYFGQKESEAAELTQKRKKEHEERRGKKKDNVDEGIVDTVKDVGKKIIKKTKEFINKPIIAPTITKDQHMQQVRDKTTHKNIMDSVEEGTSYGLYKGDGKPKGAMASFLKKKKKDEDKKKVVETIQFLRKKKKESEEEGKPKKAMDAGSRLRRKKQRQEYADKISGSEDNVPDDIRDHVELASESKIRLVKNGHTYRVILTWRGKTYMIQMFVPSVSKPTRKQVEKEVQKIYPDAKVLSFLPRELEPGEPTVMVGEEKEERDEYGDLVGGPKISKKEKKKNLAKNEKDEDHTTTTAEAVDGMKIPPVTGLGGGGGGTNAITSKAKTKTFKNYVKDAIKIATFPISRRNIRPNPTEKFASESMNGLPGLGGGGGGTDAITSKSMSKSFGKRLKDVGKVLTRPLHKVKTDPNEKFASEEYVTEDDMKGMSVKSGHKRPTKSGAGMTQKGVAAYRRKNPGSKLQTAVTGKVKKGSKDAKRRKSYCARSAGQMKKFPKAAKDPNSRLRQARKRWKC